MIKVNDLIGVPFVEFGRDVKKGLDCYGLAIEVEKRLGKNLNEVLLEKVDFSKARRYEMKLNLKETDYIQEGTLLEFYGKEDKRLHVAVALDKDMFIHATEKQGVRISSFKSAREYLVLFKKYEVL